MTCRPPGADFCEPADERGLRAAGGAADSGDNTERMVTSHMPDIIDPTRRFEQQNPIGPNAVIVTGQMKNGRACRLIDNTGENDPDVLRELLEQLIRERRFGGTGFSAAGDNTLMIGAPQCGHIQVRDVLYRLLVFPYEARIERF